MNIALILSGGVGKRFAANLPKQYNLINGKPVIDYVIEACIKSKLTDKTIVVCDPSCKQFSKYLENGEIVTVITNEIDRENGTVDIKFKCGTVATIDPVYLERLILVEELKPS